MSATVRGADLARVGQIAINVRDLARASAFYRDVLGLRHLFDAPGMAFFDCGGVRLMLALPESPEFERPASIVYYAAEDIAAARQALVARGARFESEPHVVHRGEGTELSIGFLRDTEGNPVAIMSERASE